MPRYQMKTVVPNSFADAKAKVVEALKSQGFGILTEIDVQKTLKEKIGAEMEAYQILGACNPKLAQQALEIERSIGLLLPCNVVLRELKEGTEVSIQDPQAMFEVVDPSTRERLQPLAGEARERLQQALRAL
ncbi:MAG: DUF302 domain-containing protein [Deinococcus sp.]|nr:DUF302 domain-containing protein [Deinococcus sp.]